jgi:hypothetical protein
MRFEFYLNSSTKQEEKLELIFAEPKSSQVVFEKSSFFEHSTQMQLDDNSIAQKIKRNHLCQESKF